jgi:hypothetical protein
MECQRGEQHFGIPCADFVSNVILAKHCFLKNSHIALLAEVMRAYSVALRPPYGVSAILSYAP